MCSKNFDFDSLGKVLSLDDRVRRATDHYIDDIVVLESIADAETVRRHLASACFMFCYSSSALLEMLLIRFLRKHLPRKHQP